MDSLDTTLKSLSFSNLQKKDEGQLEESIIFINVQNEESQSIAQDFKSFLQLEIQQNDESKISNSSLQSMKNFQDLESGSKQSCQESEEIGTNEMTEQIINRKRNRKNDFEQENEEYFLQELDSEKFDSMCQEQQSGYYYILRAFSDPLRELHIQNVKERWINENYDMFNILTSINKYEFIKQLAYKLNRNPIKDITKGLILMSSTHKGYNIFYAFGQYLSDLIMQVLEMQNINNHPLQNIKRQNYSLFNNQMNPEKIPKIGNTFSSKSTPHFKSDSLDSSLSLNFNSDYSISDNISHFTFGDVENNKQKQNVHNKFNNTIMIQSNQNDVSKINNSNTEPYIYLFSQIILSLKEISTHLFAPYLIEDQYNAIQCHFFILAQPLKTLLELSQQQQSKQQQENAIFHLLIKFFKQAYPVREQGMFLSQQEALHFEQLIISLIDYLSFPQQIYSISYYHRLLSSFLPYHYANSTQN